MRIVYLLLIPALAYLSILVLYRQNGKKEILKFDVVQFVYAFVIFPALFVWLKSFLFFLLRSELEISLSVGELFAIDTLMSTLFLYMYAFLVIHSLTKSFNLKYYRDPLYDIFEHSEYYHLWLSHVAIYSVAMALIAAISVLNIFVPLELEAGKVVLYSLLGVGFVTGSLGFMGIWLSDPDQAQFLRVMKLAIAFFFLIHVGVYFVFDPQFSIQHGVYWLVFMLFTTMVLGSFLFHRSEKAMSLADKFKHKLWGKKRYVMGKKK